MKIRQKTRWEILFTRPLRRFLRFALPGLLLAGAVQFIAPPQQPWLLTRLLLWLLALVFMGVEKLTRPRRWPRHWR
jgi:hypothetical protein